MKLKAIYRFAGACHPFSDVILEFDIDLCFMSVMVKSHLRHDTVTSAFKKEIVNLKFLRSFLVLKNHGPKDCKSKFNK